jgi:hypothetical protein
MSVFGVQKTNTKQNQQFNEILVSNAKINEIIGFPKQDLNIKSNISSIIFNKNLKINQNGDLEVANLIKINEGSLVNDDNNLTWNGDVVITDATLESELENLGIIITPKNKQNYTNQRSSKLNENNTDELELGYTFNPKPKTKTKMGDLLAFPVGTIIQYPLRATKIPNGWMVCDGSLIEKSKYQQMENILETYEETFFMLPDLKSKKILNLIFVGF